MNNIEQIEETLATADSIAWDGCHKIYILMDNEQTNLMREYGYEYLYTKEDVTEQDMLNMVSNWYEDSCQLRFVQAVATSNDPKDDGFRTLIGQFE